MSLAYILQDLDDPDFDDIHGDDETGGFAADKTLRLLVSALYASWRTADGAPFLAATRVAVSSGGEKASQAIVAVPDLLLAAGVAPADAWWKPVHRAYRLARFGKPPDVVLDILTRAADRPETHAARHQAYERLAIPYRAVYDPCQLVSAQPITVFERQGERLVARSDARLPRLGLGLTIWRGRFEGRDDEWLRWTDADGRPLATGDELAAYWRGRAAELGAT